MTRLLWVIIAFLGVFQVKASKLDNGKHLVVGKLYPFSNKEVELTASWIKQRESLNITWLESLESDRLLHNFRVAAGLPSSAKPLEGWEASHIGLRGHFVGHYLSAAAWVVEKYAGTHLTHNLEYVVEGLYEGQQVYGSGYLSAFPETDFDILETRFTGVWAPYYTFHKNMQGLLDVYVHTGNEKAYKMVLSMADYVERRMSRLAPSNIEQMMYTVTANEAVSKYIEMASVVSFQIEILRIFL